MWPGRPIDKVLASKTVSKIIETCSADDKTWTQRVNPFKDWWYVMMASSHVYAKTVVTWLAYLLLIPENLIPITFGLNLLESISISVSNIHDITSPLGHLQTVWCYLYHCGWSTNAVHLHWSWQCCRCFFQGCICISFTASLALHGYWGLVSSTSLAVWGSLSEPFFWTVCSLAPPVHFKQGSCP